MIKVTVNNGDMSIEKVEGDGVTVMAELCAIVHGVCKLWCSDEEESIREDMFKEMISLITKGLEHGKNIDTFLQEVD